MTDGIWALVPVKSLTRAKQRLATALRPHERAALVQAMAADVIDTLRTVTSLAGVAVVTDGDDVAGFAHAAGAAVVRETDGGGLNPALACGARALARQGAAAILVIPGDVPFIRADDIRRLIAAGDAASVIVVPSRDGRQTNGLLLGTARADLFAFGPDSAKEHQCRAAAAGLSAAVHSVASLAVDIDDPSDLPALHAGASKPGARTAAIVAGFATAVRRAS